MRIVMQKFIFVPRLKANIKIKKRAHYKHEANDKIKKECSGESIKHQSGKELIFRFVKEYIEDEYKDNTPPIEKEEYLKDPNRIPDVFIDDELIRTSIEIEYKNTDKGCISKKNKDLRIHESITQWIIGHKKVQYKGFLLLDENCREVIREQNNLLLINPFNEEIATVLYKNGNPMGDWKVKDISNNIFIDNIDDCLFSHYTGIITSPIKKMMGIKGKKHIRKLERQWEKSDLFEEFIDDIPPYVNNIHKGSYILDALPVQWQYRIFHDLIMGRKEGSSFSLEDVKKSIEKENISCKGNPFYGYIHFLNSLCNKGFIYRYQNDRWVIIDSSLGENKKSNISNIINQADRIVVWDLAKNIFYNGNDFDPHSIVEDNLKGNINILDFSEVYILEKACKIEGGVHRC